MMTHKWLFVPLVFLAACSSTVDYRGKLPEPEDLEKIQVGQSTEEDVMAAIGSPTSASQFGPQKWFYVYKKTETKAFLEPNVVDSRMVIVSFEDGKVSDLSQSTPDGMHIEPVKHKTPTVGNDRPFLKQVFSNFGRTMKKSESKK